MSQSSNRRNLKNLKSKKTIDLSSMHQKKLKYLFTLIIILSLLFIKVQSQQIIAKVLPCLEFKNRLCIRCPQLTHMQDQQCYENIQGCMTYQYGTASAVCKKYLNSTSQSTSSTLTLKNSSYFYSSTTTTYTSTNLSIQSIFKQVPYAQAQKDTLFLQCHNYMRKGQYSHFISRTQNPVQSVFSCNSNDFKDFKILYEGSGGNLLMCLIGVNIKTSVIVLRSFVTIGRTQIIEGCVDYSSTMQCSRCKDGYHLDQMSDGDTYCVVDIPGCLQYYGNICTKCRGHYYLVENRCMVDCESLRDSRGIKFYGGYDISKLQTMVVQISRDYFSQ